MTVMTAITVIILMVAVVGAGLAGLVHELRTIDRHGEFDEIACRERSSCALGSHLWVGHPSRAHLEYPYRCARPGCGAMSHDGHDRNSEVA